MGPVCHREKIQNWKQEARNTFSKQKAPFRISSAFLLYKSIALSIPQAGLAIAVFIWLYMKIVETRMALKAAKGETVTYKDLKNIGNAKKFVFTIIYGGVYQFVAFIPTMFFLLECDLMLRKNGWAGAVVCGIISFLCLFLALYIWSAVSGIFFVAAEHPDIKSKDAMRTAKIYSKGNRSDYFFLILSYFPQILLSVATLGIWYVLSVGPQIKIAIAMWYRDLGRTDIAEPEKKKHSGLLNKIQERRENKLRYGKSKDVKTDPREELFEEK